MSDSLRELSGSEVADILRRASEIDAAGEYLSVRELRRVAREAGIAPKATDAAIGEVLGDRSAAVRNAPIKCWLGWEQLGSRLLVPVCVGFGIGAIVVLLMRAAMSLQ